MTNPEELLYTKDHEWIRVDGDTGTIGITEYAQHELGDVVFVDLPQIGQSFNQSDAFGSVESVKAVSEVYCPIAGDVTEVNQAIVENPEMINQEPYGKGWMIRLRVGDANQLKELLSAAQYESYIHEQREKA